MPSNIRELRRKIRNFVEDSDNGPVAGIRQQTTTTLLTNLARTTPVRTGRLSGGWFVEIDGQGQTSSRFNLTRLPTSVNLLRAQNIEPNDEVKVVNKVPYGRAVNFGTSSISPRAFVQLALQTTQLQLAGRGLTVRWRSL